MKRGLLWLLCLGCFSCAGSIANTDDGGAEDLGLDAVDAVDGPADVFYGDYLDQETIQGDGEEVVALEEDGSAAEDSSGEDGSPGDSGCVPDWHDAGACECQPSECLGCSGLGLQEDGCGNQRRVPCELPPRGCSTVCCLGVCCATGEWCTERGCSSEYPQERVGIFYLAWHAYAWDAYQQLPAGSRPSLEDLIVDPGRSFREMIFDHGLTGQAANFHFHIRPSVDYYSIYRPRPGEPPYAEPYFVPEYPNISLVLETHARQLWQAGVDFVFVDATNLPFMSPFADVLGLRPIEVLFEEWLSLRQRGVMTPQIAVWVPIPAKPVEHPEWVHMADEILEIYNRPEFSHLVLTDARSGKKVMFIVDHPGLPPDPQVEARLQDNGGRLDVVTVHLWGLLQPADFQAGKAAWMQPCEIGGQWTTIISAAAPCSQRYTQSSPLGTVLSASTSYQIGYASLPFQASGKNNGLTFKKQFETALSVRPDYLLINSWNEFIAQPQPNPHVAGLGNLARSMGKYVPPLQPDDPARDWLWVDQYGAEFDRDIEPTVEYGTKYLELLASCLRVYRSGATFCTPELAQQETCCDIKDEHVLIYSLRVMDPENTLSTHHVLTKETIERDTLLASGQWEQVCNPVYAPPGLCAKTSGLSSDGPFLLFADPGPDRLPLYRCWSGVANFFSLDPGCEGRQVVGLLGYLSSSISSHSPRPLRRCYNSQAQVHFHWLEFNCPADYLQESVLGYVR